MARLVSRDKKMGKTKEFIQNKHVESDQTAIGGDVSVSQSVCQHVGE